MEYTLLALSKKKLWILDKLGLEAPSRAETVITTKPRLTENLN
jgi:hypothetical protein